ncbi:MAG: M48 family metalloprotease [Coleofasciculaceae cyanobacterium]
MLFESGMKAFQQGRDRDAVQMLKEFCQYYSQPGCQEYLQAQMALVKSYYRLGDNHEAIALCRELVNNKNSSVHNWAIKALQKLLSGQKIEQPQDSLSQQPHPLAKAGRAAEAGVKLTRAKSTGNLVLASGITISLLLGMVLVLFLALTLIIASNDPIAGLIQAIVFTLTFNTAAFFLSPFLMDLTQKWLYKTRWVSLAEIESQSPETAKLIKTVCKDKKLKQPRLGIIDDQNPTAFTYGSLPNNARLVVSQGLFTYLDDEEIATVYAHELGHIVHWDFAVMTLASTLVQITYLIYITARRLGRKGGNDKLKDAAGSAAIAAYIFYLIGTYLLLYLSRTREYFADHFAAETTGNPNALSRALVKIAYGILEESKLSAEPSRLIEGTRALGIYDHKAAASTGTAYRLTSDAHKLGRIFLWDLFNPWGWWMELSSTHPLTGKRVRALSNYAEQLGLDTEFDMGRVVGERIKLSKRKLYGNFVVDLLLFAALPIGLVLGLLIGIAIDRIMPNALQAFPLLGLGIGIFLRTWVMFPNYQQAATSDILTLMSNPYASPLRGQPVQLNGELIGRGDAGYQFGSDLKLQDQTGMIYLHYASRLGPIGNFFFGMKRVKNLLGAEVNMTGWFRRGVAPWVDMRQLETNSGTTVNSFHPLWSFIFAGGAIIGGFYLLFSV